jgi:aspartyl-tRNA(Asn)/glutamyl-tRNA(Gln) amidotransferase subunit C
MPIDREEIFRIARLARLKLHQTELEALSHDLTRIVAYVDRLEEVNTEHIESRGPKWISLDKLRPDRAQPSLSPGDALRNAPRTADGFFRVPKVK